MLDTLQQLLLVHDFAEDLRLGNVALGHHRGHVLEEALRVLPYPLVDGLLGDAELRGGLRDAAVVLAQECCQAVHQKGRSVVVDEASNAGTCVWPVVRP